MNINTVKSFNNKELNNRLSNLIFPSLYTQVFHFTNDIKLIQDIIFPYLLKENILSDVLESLSRENIDQENFNTLLCQYSLFYLIRRN